MSLSHRRIAVAATVVATMLVVTASFSGATSTFSFRRFSGTDRYATAAMVAGATFTTADIVVLTTGQNFPDALSANFVAGVHKAPILLTTAQSLPQVTLDAMTALKTTKVVILGGVSAVGSAVEDTLRSRGLTVSRIHGGNRYETASLAAQHAGTTAVGLLGAKRTAVVASGAQFADALGAGPLAYANKLPVLLTERDSLTEATRSALSNLAITQVILPGGTAAVSAATETAMRSMGIDVVRLSGRDRTETATLVAELAIANGFSKKHVVLARGDGFADALGGGPHAGAELAPLVLTSSTNDLGSSTRSWLVFRSSTLENGDILGGVGAVSESVAADATAAGRGTPLTTTTTKPGATTTVPGGITTTSITLPGATTLPTLPGGSTLPTLPVATTLPVVPTTVCVTVAGVTVCAP